VTSAAAAFNTFNVIRKDNSAFRPTRRSSPRTPP